jgi:outer membrane protein assembly factor BamA
MIIRIDSNKSSTILPEVLSAFFLRTLLFIFLFLGNTIDSFSQKQISIPGVRDSIFYKPDPTSNVHIRSIEVEGNRKTKSYIILREILMKQGDSILAGDIYDKLEHSRQLVYNTSLFISVTLEPFWLEGHDIKIKVTVKEKWFIYPIPQFQLVDRNFNDWLNTYDASLDRVVYGMKFVDYNFSGRRDPLRLFLLNGYSRNISISYSAPYSNPSLTEGFTIGSGLTQNREITYKTSYRNKQLQFNNGSFVRNVFNIGGSYQIRKGYYKKQIFQLSYLHYSVSDSIISKYNTEYFSESRSSMGFPDISYVKAYLHLDNINFPLEGKTWSWGISKRGISWKEKNSFLSLDGTYTTYIPHNKKWYSSIQISGRVKFPFDQPFINQRALGYEGFYLRGMEYYVVDGVAAALAKYTLRKKLFSFSIPFPFHIRQLPEIPFSFYAKAYADAGYCYNRQALNTQFNNILLYSGGIGLDILTLYDFSLRIEYSMNQLGEKGIFLHSRGGF